MKKAGLIHTYPSEGFYFGFDFIYVFLFLYQPTIFGVSGTYYLLLWALIGILFSSCRTFPFCIKLHSCSLIGRYLATVLLPMAYVCIHSAILSLPLFGMKSFCVMIFTGIELYYLYLRIINSRHSLKFWVNNLLYAGYLQTFFCILMVAFPALKEWHTNYVLSLSGEYAGLKAMADIRIYGIAGGSQYLFAIGGVHAILALLAFYWALKECRVSKTIPVFLLLIPIALNARFGFICFAAGIVALLLGISLKSKVKTLATIAKMMGAILFAGGGALLVLQRFATEKVEWVLSSIETSLALISGNNNVDLYYYYAGLLPENWILPKSLDFLFGVGYIPDAVDLAAIQFDSGYVRTIYIGGIFFLIFLIIGTASVVTDQWRKEPFANKALRIAIITILMIANMKGSVFISNTAVGTAMIIYLLMHWDKDGFSFYRITRPKSYSDVPPCAEKNEYTPNWLGGFCN